MEAGVAALVDEGVNAKPLVVPVGGTVGCIGFIVVLDAAPKVNNGVVPVAEPKPENDDADVEVLSAVDGLLPNEAVAPNAGAGVVPVDEITGANVFGGLLAPNANGVLLDVVVVVPIVGKLKPDDDGVDDETLPNKGAADVVETLKGVNVLENPPDNGSPLVVVAGGGRVEGVVVVDAAVFDEKGNRFVGIADDDVVVVDEAVELAPNANIGALSAEVVEVIEGAAVVVAIGVLPNAPNVIDVGSLAVDVVAVVSEVTLELLAAVVVVGALVDDNEPNDGNAVVAVLSALLVSVPNNGVGVVTVAPNIGAVFVPNNGAAVGVLVVVFSLLVVAIKLNAGKVLVVESGVVVINGGGIVSTFSLVVVGSVNDVDSVEVVD